MICDRTIGALAAAAALAALAVPAGAQYGVSPSTRAAAQRVNGTAPRGAADVFEAGSSSDLPERKEKSFWHRPKFDDSAEQFEHATRLEREGSRKAAMKAFDALVHRWPEAPEAMEAQLGVARIAEARGKRMRAFEEYRYLLVFFGDRLPSEAVLERMLALADKSEALGDSDDALEMYKRIAGHAPGWTKTRRALLAAARLCEADKDYSEAIRLCNRLLARAPDSLEASAAAHLSGRCGYRLAMKHDRDDSLCLKAIASLSRAGEEYPGERDADETARMLEELSARRVGDQFETAAFYDRVRRNPAAAIVSYREFARRFPGTPEARRAIERADELAILTGE